MSGKDTLEERNWINWKKVVKKKGSEEGVKEEPKGIVGRLLSRIGKSISGVFEGPNSEHYKNLRKMEQYELYNKPAFMVSLFNFYLHLINGLQNGEKLEFDGDGDLQDSKITISRDDSNCVEGSDVKEEKIIVSIDNEGTQLEFVLYVELGYRNSYFFIRCAPIHHGLTKIRGLNLDVYKGGELIGTFEQSKSTGWDCASDVHFRSDYMTGDEEKDYRFEHAFMYKLHQILKFLEKKMPMLEFEAKTAKVIEQRQKDLVSAISQ